MFIWTNIFPTINDSWFVFILYMFISFPIFEAWVPKDPLPFHISLLLCWFIFNQFSIMTFFFGFFLDKKIYMMKELVHDENPTYQRVKANPKPSAMVILYPWCPNSRREPTITRGSIFQWCIWLGDVWVGVGEGWGSWSILISLLLTSVIFEQCFALNDIFELTRLKDVDGMSTSSNICNINILLELILNEQNLQEHFAGKKEISPTDTTLITIVILHK